jgi:hypothetical protein
MGNIPAVTVEKRDVGAHPIVLLRRDWIQKRFDEWDRSVNQITPVDFYKNKLYNDLPMRRKWVCACRPR